MYKSTKRLPIQIESRSCSQIEELMKINNNEIVLVFITHDINKYKLIRNKYPGIELFCTNSIEDNGNIDNNLLNYIHFILNDENTALFYDRKNHITKNSRFEIGVNNYYRYVAKQANYCYSFYKEINVDYMFMPATPHSIDAWIATLVAEKMGIVPIVPHLSPVPWRRSLHEGINRNRKICKINNPKVANIKNDRANVYEWISRVQGSYDKAIPSYEKKRLEYNKGKYFSITKEIKRFWNRPHFIYNKYQCYTTYNKFSRNNYGSNYVAFFPQFQPERTTLPEGYGFTQQYITLMAIRACLPNYVKIVVKEHPSTFTNVCHPKHRNPSFYHDIIKMNNVVLADISSTPFEIIDNSMAVVTITGTVGLEALLRGKPVVYMGVPLINNVYGVHNFIEYNKLKIFFNECIVGMDKEKIISESIKHIHDSMKHSISSTDENGKIIDDKKSLNDSRYRLLKHFILGDIKNTNI